MEDALVDPVDHDAVAVVGIGCRFPGAPDKESFWLNLRDGRDSVRDFSPEELVSLGVPRAIVDDPSYVWASGHLDDVDCFDAPFFGFSPREAAMMDPQHRLFLEIAWSAFEDAGYRPNGVPGTVAVFAGCAMNKYLLNNLLGNASLSGADGWDDGIPPGASPDALPSRVAYHLGATGPSMAVLTACSSGLSAVVVAAESLRSYACDMALAGGVSVELPERPGYRYQEGGILSRDGRCRPYDADASGSVFGSGAGAVVLKRLEDAIADGDHIYATLRGWAMNNDGRNRAGYTAPGVEGQAAVVLEALERAKLRPEQLQYVEGHGSGTKVGDPIEVRSLTQAFRAAGSAGVGYCGLGSVKSNIGHVDAAAGIAGLIKVVLSIDRAYLPATLHFQLVNPQIDLEHSPFHVVAEGGRWPGGGSRRAGVSSFGMGGANAHVIVEQAPERARTDVIRPYELFLLSAATEAAVEQTATRLAEWLRNSDDNLHDVCHTLAHGRAQFHHRRALVCGGVEEAAENLAAGRGSPVRSGEVPTGTTRSVAFMFPGVGDAYVGLATDLYQCEQVFREEVDRCAELLMPVLDADLRDHLFPNDAWRAPWDGSPGTRPAKMDLRAMRRGAAAESHAPARTVFDQPATFVIEYALARQLIAWGIEPTAMIGHSVGEYVAACLAGVFSLRDALTLVARRAQLIGQLPAGGMLAVPLPASECGELIRPGVCLGAVNATSLTVLSGLNDVLDEIEKELRDRGTLSRRVRAEHPFHSHLVDPIVPAVGKLVENIALNPPRIPYVSGVTGTWIEDTEATSSEYWTTHMRKTVMFAPGIATLAQEENLVYLEIGPGQTLSSFALATVADQPDIQHRVISVMQPYADRASALRSALDAVGRVWVAGGSVDVDRVVRSEGRRRVPLPTYPFERRRYWVDRVRPAFTAAVPEEGRTVRHSTGALVPSHQATRPAAPGHDAARHAIDRSDPPRSGPMTEMEKLIADAWCDLLGYPEVGLDADFFHLGGHSLLALQLANKLWQDHKLELAYSAILEGRTVRRLAASLAEEAAVGSAPVADDRAAPQPVREVPPLVPGPPAALMDVLAGASDAVSVAPAVSDTLARRLGRALGRPVHRDETLAECDLSRAVPDLVLELRRELGMPVYPNEIEARPSVALLGRYLAEQWIRWSRRDVPAAAHQGPMVERAAFVLSSPRAGSTLLRVMLAGSPELFCPPELHLLATPDMAQRSLVEPGSDRNQGIQRAFVELTGISPDAAAERLTAYERAGVPTTEVFRELVDLASPRLLVDKSPGNGRYLETLQLTERLVREARYIHLVRHPYSVIDSMVRNRFTQLMGAGEMDPFEFGEHIWSTYNANIVDFLDSVDEARCIRVRYEDLVRQPEKTMRQLSDTLDVPFIDSMLQPYEGRRMRDGLGDPNFLQHSAIEADLADAWRNVSLPRHLNGLTRRLAEELGYGRSR